MATVKNPVWVFKWEFEGKIYLTPFNLDYPEHPSLVLQFSKTPLEHPLGRKWLQMTHLRSLVTTENCTRVDLIQNSHSFLLFLQERIIRHINLYPKANYVLLTSQWDLRPMGYSISFFQHVICNCDYFFPVSHNIF